MNTATLLSSELLVAVLAASVVGSLHCVGMCGPFALMATGSAAGKDDGRRWRIFSPTFSRLVAYHLGRLTTYLLAGGLAGFAGFVLSQGGQSIGIQSAAARVAGVSMIVLGLFKLFRVVQTRRGVAPAAGSSSGAFSLKISGAIAKTRPFINRLPGFARAYAAGALTTLLPCGWLYMFLLVAAGTGHGVSAMAVMLAFWVGSLPALTAVVYGVSKLAPQIRHALPVAGAILLLLSGIYTASGRAATNMDNLTRRANAVKVLSEESSHSLAKSAATSEQSNVAQRTLEVLNREPLPCCRD